VASVDLIGVWINNFYSDGSKGTTLLSSFPTPPASGIVLYPMGSTVWGITPSTSSSPKDTPFGSSVTFGVPYAPQAYYNAYHSDVELDADSKVYAYHIFAGDNIPHLILLVKGEYDEDYYSGDDKYFLGWVTFKRFKEGGVDITTILPNYIYKIGVGTTGIAIDADDITPDPEMTVFDLGIDVVITPWLVKNVTPGV
jgi:hypothetical protein